MRPTYDKPLDAAEAMTIREVEVDDPSPVRIELALRTLARLMVRAHARKRDPVANEGQDSASSALTLVPQRSPDHDDENAA